METLLRLIEIQRTSRSQWSAYYFPAIDSRGCVLYDDIVQLTTHQAEALRYLLVDQYLYASKQLCRSRARSVTFHERDPEESADEPAENHWTIRIRLFKEALDDICTAYGLSSPLSDPKPAVR